MSLAISAFGTLLGSNATLPAYFLIIAVCKSPEHILDFGRYHRFADANQNNAPWGCTAKALPVSLARTFVNNYSIPPESIWFGREIGMAGPWLSRLIICALTCANLKLFTLRWAQPIPPRLPEFGSEAACNALALGISGAALCMSLFRLARERRPIALLLLCTLSSAWVWSLLQLAAFESFFLPSSLAIAGAFIALLCFRPGPPVTDSPRTISPLKSFTAFVLVAFNALLLFAPLSSQTPSFAQDRFPFSVTLRQFYFGSIHSDLSPVSMGLRHLINLFFDHPSINATALSSIVYVSLGLGFAALSVQMVLGRTWAWMLLAVGLTDKWILVAALSSALLGQPLVLSGLALYLCTWATMRPRAELSLQGAPVLGGVLALGIVYSLYSYSGARLTWLVGIGALGIILICRGALPLNVRGCLRCAACILPSAAMVLLIWSVLFERNSERFLNQLFISPPLAHRVADLSSYHEKLTPVHDPDVPIWWGTARPETENKSLYWRRSPFEIYDKALWILKRMGREFLMPRSLVALGVLGLLIGLVSKRADLRGFAYLSLLFALSTFGTYLLAQDSGAYRRAVSFELFLCVGVIMLFGALSHRGRMRILTTILCGIFVVVKTPLQVNALLDVSLYGYTCPICQPHIEIRSLANSPLLASVRNREVLFSTEGGGTLPFYGECARHAVNSAEFKQLVPRSSMLSLVGRPLGQAVSAAPKGAVLIVSCTDGQSPEIEATHDPDVRALCDGTPRFGALLGSVVSSAPGPKFWWSFSEVGENSRLPQVNSPPSLD